jgi:hypothetical protein
MSLTFNRHEHIMFCIRRDVTLSQVQDCMHCGQSGECPGRKTLKCRTVKGGKRLQDWARSKPTWQRTNEQQIHTSDRTITPLFYSMTVVYDRVC